jgi:hypothetical protein
MAEEAVLEVKPRVIEVKGKARPPVGYPYYGLTTRDGLKPVLIRTERKRADKPDAIHDQLEWYEKSALDKDGAGTTLLYYLRVAPQLPLDYEPPTYQFPLYPECLYPVAIWNITKALFSDVDNVPCWRKMQALTVNNSQVSASGMSFFAFHFVVVNHKYTPKEIRPGLTDDGNWAMGLPVTGQWIIDKFTAEEAVGRDPLLYTQTIEPVKEIAINA